MKVEELRIGNIIKTLQGVGSVMSMRHAGKQGYGIVLKGQVVGSYAEHCEGVPLTGEHLLGCGFEMKKIGIVSEYRHPMLPTYFVEKLNDLTDYTLRYSDSFLKREGLSIKVASVKCMHQLQNICFAITGKELEVKL